MDRRKSWHFVQSKLAIGEAYYEQVREGMESSTTDVPVVLQEVVPLHDSPSQRCFWISPVIIFARSVLPTEKSAI